MGSWDAIMLARVRVLVNRLDECGHVIAEEEGKPAFNALGDVAEGAEGQHGRDGLQKGQE